jgi:hypothetical protein
VYFILEVLLLLLQQVRNVLLEHSFSLNDLASNLIEYLADFTPILVGRVFQLSQMVLHSEYLVLHFILLSQSSLQRHFEHELLFGTSLLSGDDLMGLVVLIEYAVNAEYFLI